MASDPGTGAPIYDSLVDEHGDVAAEARHAAAEVQRSAQQALHISGRHHPQPEAGRPRPPQQPAPPPPEHGQPPAGPGTPAPGPQWPSGSPDEPGSRRSSHGDWFAPGRG
ncbi:hypothetical protein HOY81_17110 [Streptomyces sp. JJ36]|nr:hypothetical protein [Streptomyces sp. JJ36]